MPKNTKRAKKQSDPKKQGPLHGPKSAAPGPRHARRRKRRPASDAQVKLLKALGTLDGGRMPSAQDFETREDWCKVQTAAWMVLNGNAQAWEDESKRRALWQGLLQKVERALHAVEYHDSTHRHHPHAVAVCEYRRRRDPASEAAGWKWEAPARTVVAAQNDKDAAEDPVAAYAERNHGILMKLPIMAKPLSTTEAVWKFDVDTPPVRKLGTWWTQVQTRRTFADNAVKISEKVTLIGYEDFKYTHDTKKGRGAKKGEKAKVLTLVGQWGQLPEMRRCIDGFEELEKWAVEAGSTCTGTAWPVKAVCHLDTP